MRWNSLFSPESCSLSFSTTTALSTNPYPLYPAYEQEMHDGTACFFSPFLSFPLSGDDRMGGSVAVCVSRHVVSKRQTAVLNNEKFCSGERQMLLRNVIGMS